MKRLGIAMALLLSLGHTGCRLFEPEQPPVYYPPVYYQSCPQVCVQAASQCLPATTMPSTTPVPSSRPILGR
jgi:hypothetical protein